MNFSRKVSIQRHLQRLNGTKALTMGSYNRGLHTGLQDLLQHPEKSSLVFKLNVNSGFRQVSLLRFIIQQNPSLGAEIIGNFHMIAPVEMVYRAKYGDR